MAELILPPAAGVRPRRFTSDEVRAMLRAGILHEDDRLDRLFVERTTPDIAVSIQHPVRIDPHNEPEPDMVLTSALDGAPRPDDALSVERLPDCPSISVTDVLGDE